MSDYIKGILPLYKLQKRLSIPLNRINIDSLSFIIEFEHVFGVVNQEIFEHCEMIVVDREEDGVVTLQVICYSCQRIVVSSWKHLEELFHVEGLAFVLVVELAVAEEASDVFDSFLASLDYAHTRCHVFEPF